MIRKIAFGAVILGSVTMLGLTGCSKSEKQETAAPGRDTSAMVTDIPAADSPIITELKARLEARPNDPDTLQRLGDAYFDAKRFNEAVTYYKKALEFKPGDADIFNDLGLSLHYLGNPAGGLTYIEEGIKKNPYHQRIWLTKGFILAYGMGDLDAARSAWEKANALNPESQVGKAASEFLAQINKK
ncbi:MAG: tetratricopeptide repeat protein [Deltaproteobacteria bacterium]|nr:tetratricopeptide repeat protein [Deltaproteobacteria bacterium]